MRLNLHWAVGPFALRRHLTVVKPGFKWRIAFVLVSICGVSGTSIDGFGERNTQAQQAVATNSTQKQTVAPLVNNDVLEMLRAGLSDEVVIAKIKTSACRFDTSVSALQQLKAAAVPDSIILAIVQAPVSASQPDEVGTSKPTQSTPDISQFMRLLDHLQKATVHFYNLSNNASIVEKPIFCDNKLLVRLERGEFFTARIELGRHTFSTYGKSPLIADLINGQELYIWVGGASGDGRLLLVDQDRGSADIKDLKPHVATEPIASTVVNISHTLDRKDLDRKNIAVVVKQSQEFRYQLFGGRNLENMLLSEAEIGRALLTYCPPERCNIVLAGIGGADYTVVFEKPGKYTGAVYDAAGKLVFTSSTFYFYNTLKDVGQFIQSR